MTKNHAMRADASLLERISSISAVLGGAMFSRERCTKMGWKGLPRVFTGVSCRVDNNRQS